MGVMGEWVFFSLLLFLFWFNFSLIGANDKNKVFYWSITKTKTIKISIHPTHPVKLTATEESFLKTSTPLGQSILIESEVQVVHEKFSILQTVAVLFLHQISKFYPLGEFHVKKAPPVFAKSEQQKSSFPTVGTNHLTRVCFSHHNMARP